MADSLILTGVKDVKKHTGTEMLLTRPKRGGDTHAIKEWWNDRNGKQYCNCTVFDVTVGADTVKLALKTNMSTNIRIDHDGAFEFNFYGINEIERACLFTTDLEVIEHYVFPRISGGKVMTVTPAGAASKPGGGGAITIGTVTIDGPTSSFLLNTEVYNVNISGNAGDAQSVITSSDPMDFITPGNPIQVLFQGTPGDRTLTATVTSSTANDSGATGTLVVNTELPNVTIIETVSISGEQSPNNGDSENYTATVTGDATPFTYTWNVTGGTINGDTDTQTINVTWNSAGTQTVDVIIESTNADWDNQPGNGTFVVNVA